MSQSSVRRRCASAPRVIALFVLAVGQAQAADSPPPLLLAQYLDRYAQFEQCANACQVVVDAAIARCPGYREVQQPSDASPAPPQCKRRAVEVFERCIERCPAPPTDNQG